jgi:hypothetical protein
MVEDLVRTLSEYGIEPVGSEFAPRSIHTEQRVLSVSELERIEVISSSDDESSNSGLATDSNRPDEVKSEVREAGLKHHPESHSQSFELQADDGQSDSTTLSNNVQTTPISTEQVQVVRMLGLDVHKYRECNAPLTGDPREVNADWIAKCLVKIIAIEGPVIAKRACDIYLRSVGVKRMGHEIKSTMTQALKLAIKAKEVDFINEADSDDLMDHIFRPFGSEMLVVRTRGDR